MLRSGLCISILPVVFLLHACKVKKHSQVQEPEQKASIVFITSSIYTDSATGKTEVKLLGKEVVEGNIKGHHSEHRGPHALFVEVYQQGKLSDTLSIDHPLYKHFEYLNAHNKFEVKDTVLRQADFFIRIRLSGSTGTLRIYETIPQHYRKLITTMKL